MCFHGSDRKCLASGWPGRAREEGVLVDVVSLNAKGVGRRRTEIVGNRDVGEDGGSRLSCRCPWDVYINLVRPFLPAPSAWADRQHVCSS